MNKPVLLYMMCIGVFWLGVSEAAPFSNGSYIAEYEGREVTLQCATYSAKYSSDVDWVKKSESSSLSPRVATKLLSGSILFFGSWEGNVQLKDDNSLIIDHLRYPRDEGIFECSAGNGARTQIHVLSNPDNIEIKDSWLESGVPYLNVTRGKNTTVECRVKGGKQPDSYIWLLENRDITQSSFNSKLTYSFEKSDHHKTLRCKTGLDAEGYVRLNVFYAPSTPLITPSAHENLEVDEDSRVTLRCRSDGNPAPSVTWFRGGQLVHRGEAHVIDRIRRSDTGEYTCKVKNQVDEARHQINLVIKYPPSVSLIHLEGRLLTCQAFDGYPESYTFQTWRHEIAGREVPINARSETRVDNTLTLDMSHVSYRNSGTYFCYVTNGVKGIQTSTKTINVLSKPAFAKQPGHFSGVRSESLDIHIGFWSNPPPKNVQWLKKNKENKQEVLTGEWFSIAQREISVNMEVFPDFSADMPGYQTVLIITRFSEKYSGLYTVKVTNSEGEATYDIFITTEESNMVVTAILMSVFLFLVVGGIVLKLLSWLNIIHCPCKGPTHNKVESSDCNMKLQSQASGRNGHRTSCARSRQSLQLTIPKCPTIQVIPDTADQRYIPMSATPATPTAPILPDPEQTTSEVCDYIRANVTQGAPPLREVIEPTYEDVVYANRPPPCVK